MELVNFDKVTPSINTKNTFLAAFQDSQFNGDLDYKEKLDEMATLAKDYAASKGVKLTNGAISNSRGSWYEWLIALEAYNLWCNTASDLIMLPLPNIRRFDYSSLYEDKTYFYIQDLRKKLSSSLDIELISSNPDFVILNSVHLNIERKLITQVNADTFEFIDTMYREFIGKCSFEDILGYTAAKTSLRPDRRLQIIHEGSLTKAMYVHLQTRNWESSPKGIKYFGITLALKARDIVTLKTVATHSITTVLSKPEKAVDECFEVYSSESLESFWHGMHKLINS